MNKKTFIKAAELIDTGEERFSCCAIDTVLQQYFSYERRLYMSIFCPDGMDELNWAVAIGKLRNCRELRLLMLCLMAACYRDFQ